MKYLVAILLGIGIIASILSCEKNNSPTPTKPPAPTKSSEKQITEFKFAALNPVVSAVIDQTTRKISANVPASLTALIPTISLSDKAILSPASGVVQNFNKPVSYTVTAEDGSTQV